MATFLAYLEPVPGRLYPMVATLQELVRRGHRIVVRSGSAEAGLMRSAGIDAGLLAPELARVEPQDWRARTRFGALMRALNPTADTGHKIMRLMYAGKVPKQV